MRYYRRAASCWYAEGSRRSGLERRLRSRDPGRISRAASTVFQRVIPARPAWTRAPGVGARGAVVPGAAGPGAVVRGAGAPGVAARGAVAPGAAGPASTRSRRRDLTALMETTLGSADVTLDELGLGTVEGNVTVAGYSANLGTGQEAALVQSDVARHAGSISWSLAPTALSATASPTPCRLNRR